MSRFGIFIHWGVYSVPAWAPVGTYAEWYWHDLILQQNTSGPTWQFHANTYGPNFKYQQVGGEGLPSAPPDAVITGVQFADMFHAELFNATQWLEIIKASGAQYVVPTSKHHEGFCLWPTDTSWNWNAYDVRLDLGRCLALVLAPMLILCGRWVRTAICSAS